MIVTVTWTTTSGKVLSSQDFRSVVEACTMLLDLEASKYKVEYFFKRRRIAEKNSGGENGGRRKLTPAPKPLID